MSDIEIIKLSSRLLYTEGKKCLFISLVHNRMHVVILMRVFPSVVLHFIIKIL